jgi:hypothetical protein
MPRSRCCSRQSTPIKRPPYTRLSISSISPTSGHESHFYPRTPPRILYISPRFPQKPSLFLLLRLDSIRPKGKRHLSYLSDSVIAALQCAAVLPTQFTNALRPSVITAMFRVEQQCSIEHPLMMRCVACLRNSWLAMDGSVASSRL